MNIYFVASISGRKKYLAHYELIITTLRKLGYQVTEDTLGPTDEEVYGLSPAEKKDFYKKVLKWIVDNNVFIAEVSHSSLGVGHEISLALERNKPAIVLYTEGEAPHFLEGRESENLFIAKYTFATLENILKEALETVFPLQKDSTPSYFGKLLRKFRTRAGFETLQDLCQALAHYGLDIDPSLLSHWQRGSRLPKDRKVFLFLIKALVKHGGISIQDEANELCEAAGRGYLTKRETKEVFSAIPVQIQPSKDTSLQIYFSAAIAQKDQFGKAYEQIVKMLKVGGHTIYQDTTQVSLEEAVNKNKAERTTYYKQVLLWLNQADILVVEVSFPSTLHIGHEISLALERRKPVLAFYKEGYEPSFFLGREDEKLIWVEYNEENLSELVKKEVSKTQKKFF